MPTVINNPPSNNSDSGMGAGMIIGIVIAIVVFLVLAYFYGLPLLRGGAPQQQNPGATINIQLPQGGNNGGGNTQGQ